MKPQDCADFFRFTADQALQDAEAAQALELQSQAVEREIHAKQRELVQRGGHIHPDRIATINTLALTYAGEFELEISYLDTGESLHPPYDVYVQIADGQNAGNVG